MKIKRLELENVRSYDDQTVEFPEGVILVHGENGSGKTSLLMGIFGGLFLSKITNVGSNSFTLEDLVRRGEDSARVELVFEVGGAEYTTEWRLHSTNTASTAELTSPALSAPVTGVRTVRAEVARLVGMDAEDFASSVYVKQGEVDRLIDTDDRTTTIDSLLGLDELDDHTERMKQVRRAAGRIRTANAERRRGHQEDRDEYDRDDGDFRREIAALTDDIETAETNVETAEEYLEDLKEYRREKEAAIERYEDLVDEARTKAERIERTEEKRDEQRSTIEEAEDEIEDAKAEIEKCERQITDLADRTDNDIGDESRAEEAREVAVEALTEVRTEKASLKSKLESAREEYERLDSERENANETLRELEDERAAVRERYETAEKRVEEAKVTIEEAIEERNRRVASFLPDPEPADVTDEHRETVEMRLDAVAEEREKATNALTEARTKREVQASALDEARSNRDEREERLDALREEQTALGEGIEEAKEDVTATEDEFASMVEDIEANGEALGIAVSADELDALRNERLPARRNELTDALSEVKSRIAAFETEKRRHEEDLDELRNLDDGGTCPTCGQTVSQAHVESEIDELEAKLGHVRERKANRENEHDDQNAERDDLDALRAAVTETIEYRENVLETHREELTELCEREEEIDDEIAETTDDIEEAAAEIERIENEIDRLDEKIDALEADEREAREAVSTGEEVLEAFDGVAEHRDLLEDTEAERDALEDDLSDLKDDIETRRNDIGSLEESLEEQQSTVEERETALEDTRERVGDAEAAKSVVEGAIERYDAIDDRETTISKERQRVAGAERSIEEFNEQLATLEREREKIGEELGEQNPTELREEIRETETRIEERDATREEYAARARQLREQRSRLEIERENLARLRERIELCERKEHWADGIYGEIETVLSVYQRVKSELREEYLAYINEYTNEIFGQIYKNSGYQQVHVEEVRDERRGTYDYAVRLLRDDGQYEDPKNASGGERAIVNLALRAGIYRLIAEMGGGDRSALPPFILDEPTTFLDEGHVGELEKLLRTLGDWDVPQVIVVSHDERLIHGADHECIVTKDAATKTSRAEMHVAGRAGAAGGVGSGEGEDRSAGVAESGGDD